MDGQTLLCAQQSDHTEHAEQLGIRLAQQLLQQGAGELLSALH